MKIFQNWNSGFWFVLLLGCCAAFCFQGSRGIWAPDEGFYAVIATAMLQERELLIPQLNHELWLDKPPLAMWGIAAGMALLGQNEWGARFFHALSYVATLLLVMLLGRALWGRRAGLLAGLFYLLMVFPLIGANVITPDAPLTFFTTLALYCFWNSARPDTQNAHWWKLALCAALGCGFLTKGPAALIPTGGFFIYLLLRRRALSYFICRVAPLCLLVFAAIGLSWYAYLARNVPGALEYLIDNQLLGRTISDKYARNADMSDGLLYLPVLVLGTLPGALFGWYAVWQNRRALISGAWWRAQFGDAPTALLLLTVVCSILLLALASSKLPLYLLPIFPALACLFGRVFNRGFKPTQYAAEQNCIVPFLWKLAVVFTMLMIGVKALSAHFPSEKSMRQLYFALQEHLPARNYEIVAVDERLEGLTFYGVEHLENTTNNSEAYPFFKDIEHVSEEVREMADANYCHLYLGKRERRMRPLLKLLRQAGVQPKIVELPHERWLLVCPPGKTQDDRIALAVAGDIGFGERSQGILASSIFLEAGERCLDGVVLLGDNYYIDEDDNSSFDSITRRYFEDNYQSLIRRGVPFYAILGNHDYSKPGLERFVKQYPRFNMRNRDYYSQVFGEQLLELFCLNSNLTDQRENARQLEWFEGALKQSRARWKVVAIHHPLHTNANKHLVRGDRAQTFKPLIEKYGVAIVLQGDNHVYERTLPDQQTYYFTVGSSGKIRGGSLDINAIGLAAGVDDRRAFLMLDFNAASCHFTALDLYRNVLDEGDIPHRDQQSALGRLAFMKSGNR